MTPSTSRRRAWSALLLAGVLLVALGLNGVAAETKDKAKKGPREATPTTAPSPTPTPAPTPEPTPYPEFDPDTVAIRTDVLTDEMESPVYVVDDNDRRTRCLYIVEQDGQVWMVERGTGYKNKKPFLDIRRLVTTGPEQGLHSIAFHPDFAKNGRFFAHYNDKNNAAVIAEFKGKACRPYVKGGNRPVKTLLTVEQDFPNNSAGWIGFGPDGNLYVPLGDGGGLWPGDPNGNGQSNTTRLSKVLRIDVDDPKSKKYAIPPSNPYVKRTKEGKLASRGGFPRETWAWGLRDPRRSSFDRETGDFWIGDVGQDRHEEINLVRAGSVKKNDAPNFGWSALEGESSCHPNVPDCDPSIYTAPIHSYDKVAPHRAVTGGYVYRGKTIPALEGVYLFSDLASGYIWGLDADAIYEGFEVPAHLLLDAPQGFVSFGEDDFGELYLVSLAGTVYRLNAEAR